MRGLGEYSFWMALNLARKSDWLLAGREGEVTCPRTFGDGFQIIWMILKARHEFSQPDSCIQLFCQEITLVEE
jgi:hypothetical protein